MDLSGFLVSAKRKTYAAGDRGKEECLDDGGKRYTYAQGDLLYRDTFYGVDPFGGQELVFQNTLPIWLMNYWGKTLTPQTTELRAEDLYAFLRKALARVEERRPCRGPSSFVEGRFHYLDVLTESPRFFQQFAGREQIFFQSHSSGAIKVYELFYHGGPLDTSHV